MVASDSESDLPVFPLLNPAFMHDSHGFLHSFFRMKNFLPDFHVEKLLLDSAHDAMPYYVYWKRHGIQPFIDLNEKRGIKERYKDDFTIGKDGIPVCRAGKKWTMTVLKSQKQESNTVVLWQAEWLRRMLCEVDCRFWVVGVRKLLRRLCFRGRWAGCRF